MHFNILIVQKSQNTRTNFEIRFSSIKSIILPNLLTEINDHVFDSFKLLTEVIIPQTKIGESVCYDRPNFQNISLPRCFTSIGPNKFSKCSSLTEIEIPSHVDFIPDNLFSECTQIKSILFIGNIQER